jgi:protein gp37
MKSTKIEWTEATWNPVTGCSKISAGCLHCYAERMARRLQAMGQPNYREGFKVVCHPEALRRPLAYKQARMIFVNSMSDLFHEDVSETFIRQIFDVMRQAYWHQFQVLTKRSGRLKELARTLNWPENVWVGVTVEEEPLRFRIDDLREVPSAIRFLSLEPLLGPLHDLDLSHIDWVIVGGESGPGSRPIERSWVRDIRDQCRAQGVAFFFKQWGGVDKKKTGRALDGRLWDEIPEPSVPSGHPPRTPQRLIPT